MNHIHDLETNTEVPEEVQAAWELLKQMTALDAAYAAQALLNACQQRLHEEIMNSASKYK